MFKAKKKSIVLCILDGFGIRQEKIGNAVSLAKTPTIDRLLSHYPNSTSVCYTHLTLPTILLV